MPNEAEIKKMKRGELNEFAAGIGLEPDDYSRADDLRSAVFKQLQAQEKQQKAAEAENKTEEATKGAIEEKTKPKQTQNPPRSRLMRKSKRYRQAREKVDKTAEYELKDALKLAQQTSTVNFDATVEMHINLGVDPKQADQLVRGTVVLPHGSGKSQKIAVLAPESEHTAIKKAGADIVGYKDLLDKISKGDIEFDILVAHPDVMKDLSKQAKVLGPKGLMPSPKAGTVSSDPAETTQELKSGRIEFRVDRYGIIHQAIGRVSLKLEQLQENAEMLLEVVKAARPSSSKGVYLQKIAVTTSMGPSVKVDVNSLE